MAEAKAADPRFNRLTAAVSRGVATVGGRGADPAAVWALAAVVRTVPGVTRVVVRDVGE